MNSNNLEYLTTVKKEYQEQLVSILSKQVYLGIKQLYNDVKKQCIKTRDRNVMAKFQEQMSLVPQWGTDLINRETQRITQKSQCEYLQDLIAAVFLSNTKILSATSKKRQIDVDVPSLSIFVHGVYKEVARSLYSNPELIRDYDLDKWEQQRNYRECKVLIDNAIETTIRKHLPFKNILTNYLEFSINDQVEKLSPEKKRRSRRQRVYESDDEESLESYASWDSESFTDSDNEEEEKVNKSTKKIVEEIIVDDEDDSENIVVENEEDVDKEDVVEEDVVEEDIVEEDIVEEDNNDVQIIKEEINVDESDEEDEIVIEEDIIKIPEKSVIEKENIILEEEDNITNEEPIIEEEPVIEEEFIEEVQVIEEGVIEEKEENIKEDILIEEMIDQTEDIEEVVINDDINKNTSTQDIELYDSANDENIKEEIRKIPISSNARRNLGLVKNLEKESKKSKKTKTPKKPQTMNALFFPDLEDDDDF